MEKGAPGPSSLRSHSLGVPTHTPPSEADSISNQHGCACCLESRVFFQDQRKNEAKQVKRPHRNAPDEGYTYTPPLPLNTCAGSPLMVFGQPGPVSIVTVFSSWGPQPVSVSCPYCKTFVTTQVCPQPGLLTWLMCSGMAMLGCAAL
ncbi:hypothetical protein HPB49_016167 [Dermacentor silvarum]|uniref:Uncharacterized protein n=1 Tax=Dermacentor silvarum TaxID=543639 RepID=A0ACB8DEK2_DERSI|nr:hypothetical protein HPB49_016167 [Dermacentor silvarum]